MIDYQKRQRVARLLSVFGFFILVVLTKCSSQDAVSESAKPDDSGEWPPIPLAAPEIPTDQETYPVDEKGTTNVQRILVLGSDSSDLSKGRTDTLMIAVLDHSKERLGVLSIPRDLWVDIPGIGEGRINKVVRVANNLLGAGAGPGVLAQIIERDFGIVIDGTVQINLEGLESLIDRLGGINVDVVCPIKDNFVSSQTAHGYETLDLNPGLQRLDGRTALLFARSRHGRTDMDRARRQQAIVLGLQKQLGSVATIPKFVAMWHLVKKHLTCDLGAMEIYQLARFAAHLDKDQIHGLVLKSPTVASWDSPDGKQVVRLNRHEFDKAYASLFNKPSLGYLPTSRCRPKDAAIVRDYGGTGSNI